MGRRLKDGTGREPREGLLNWFRLERRVVGTRSGVGVPGEKVGFWMYSESRCHRTC